ncbi:hypothetical protein Btru_057197 [Bulinus truncatus]|nr:hypothetical protein Btru_057197 [Bulinus truncatus]
MQALKPHADNTDHCFTMGTSRCFRPRDLWMGIHLILWFEMFQAPLEKTMAAAQHPASFQQNQQNFPSYEVMVVIEEPYIDQQQLSGLLEDQQVLIPLGNAVEVPQVIQLSHPSNVHVSNQNVSVHMANNHSGFHMANNQSGADSANLPTSVCVVNHPKPLTSQYAASMTTPVPRCVLKVHQAGQLTNTLAKNELKKPASSVISQIASMDSYKLPGTLSTTNANTNVVLEGPLQIIDPSKLTFPQPDRRAKLTTKDLKQRPRSFSQTRNIEDNKSLPGLKTPMVDETISQGHVNPSKPVDRRSSFPFVSFVPEKKTQTGFETTDSLTKGTKPETNVLPAAKDRPTQDYKHLHSSSSGVAPLKNVKTFVPEKKLQAGFEITNLLKEQESMLVKNLQPATKDKPTQDHYPMRTLNFGVALLSGLSNSNSIASESASPEDSSSSPEISEYDKTKNMEDLSCNFKWLFSEEKLRNTPSVEIGISMEQELTFRQKQAMLIQTIGLKSGLTQLAVNTSVIFMHRFYMFRDVKSFPRVHLALGFAFAGGKVEESARKLEHLIRTSVDIIRSNKNREFLDKNDPLTYEMDCQWRTKMEALCQNACNIESTAYQEMRKLVLECETEIYAVIGFQLQIVHPHNYVIRMCALLGAENIKDISQYAYNLATASSQLTMLCLKYKPETIATMCLNIAAIAHSVKFVSMKEPNVKWYQVLHSQTDISEIEAVSEEFLNLIKGCPLLPSWMSNLSRMSRAANNRALPAQPRSSAPSSAAPGSKQGHIPVTSAAAASGSLPISSSSAAAQPSRSSQQPARAESSQLSNSAQELSISPTSKQLTVGDHAASTGAAHSKDPSHSRQQGVMNPQMRPPPSSSTAIPPNPNHHQQHHRSHSSGGRQPNPPSSAPSGNASNSKPQPRHSLPTAGSTSGNRPPNTHTQPSLAHPSSHQPSSRPSGEVMKQYDPSRPHDHSRHNHDPSRQSRHQDSTRHPLQRPEVQPESAIKSQFIKEEPRLHQAKSSGDYISSQESLEQPLSTTPPSQTPSPPEIDLSAMGLAPEVPKAPTDSTNQLHLQAPKLSLSMYRERAAKSKAAAGANELNVTDELGHVSGMMEENIVYDALSGSPTEKNLKPIVPNAELNNFSSQQMDSPNAPSLKIKVKLDPSGERHYVKNTEPGLKLKIKPFRSDAPLGLEDVGASGSKLSSRSSTPFEEGEIIDESSPALSTAERKSEGLKIRLSVPRSGDSRRESDHSSNGHERESHRSHHHSHQHRSHHHKSKKHSSKHDRSRHESKSSKRAALDYIDERAAKVMKLDASESARRSGHHETHSSQVLQHQNSGFSINDAFSSTLPNNIFDDDDDDDDGSHAHPPITPTPESLYNAEKMNPRLSRHKLEYKRPPLPKGLPPPSPPPPPPSPPIL